MILEKVKKTILEHGLIEKNDKVILGISGGHDSSALLDILLKLKKDFKIELILAHVNYGYRGKDSDQDEKFVRKLAKKHHLKIYVKKIDPKSYENKTGLESYFRTIRYDFFKEIFLKEKAQKIALAHTLSDQIETVLMFFLRGSGLAGLTGMDYRRGEITRPLLDISREELTKYLEKNKLKWQKDITNESTDFTRNKIRLKLIPFLEKEFNPNLKNTLKMTVQIIKENEEVLNNLVKEIFPQIARTQRTSAPVVKLELFLNLQKFLILETGLQRLILRKILSDFGQDKISFVFLDDILAMVELGQSGSRKIVGDVKIFKKKRRIIFEKIKGS
ncbi:MAG: tRNA lysidine(34) synthetase TilS [Patescibacteria group bacterium]